VWDLYLRGRTDQIVNYNECDAFTTHLLWARMAHFGGLLDKKAYETEQRAVRQLLEECVSQGKAHLQTYLNKWNALQEMMRG
jgi:predicted PolB exonuclease-like 3'-5' exonuclease